MSLASAAAAAVELLTDADNLPEESAAEKVARLRAELAALEGGTAEPEAIPGEVERFSANGAEYVIRRYSFAAKDGTTVEMIGSFRLVDGRLKVNGKGESYPDDGLKVSLAKAKAAPWLADAYARMIRAAREA